MLDDYQLNPWQARICRLLAAAFLVVAVIQASAIGRALVAPELLAIDIRCDGSGCGISGKPVLLLPDDKRREVEGSASASARFAAHLALPSTRLKLVATGAVGSLPIVALLLFVAVALRRLARRGSDDLARAIPWLRRASVAALVAVPLLPLGESLRTTVLLDAIRPERDFSFYVDVNRLILNLLLAFAAFAVTWALAAGSRAGRDMAEIV